MKAFSFADELGAMFQKCVSRRSGEGKSRVSETWALDKQAHQGAFNAKSAHFS